MSWCLLGTALASHVGLGLSFRTRAFRPFSLASSVDPPNCSYAFKQSHGAENPDMKAYDTLVDAFMESVDQETDLDNGQTPWANISYWLDDILTDAMHCVSPDSPQCTAEDGYCTCLDVEGGAMCCPWLNVAPPIIAEGDPHITSLTGQKFDLWKLGWSTFLQVPQKLVDGQSPKLLVRGNLRRYWGDNECAPAYLDEVALSGSWTGNRNVSVKSGSLESDQNFTVAVDGGPGRRIQHADGTSFVSVDGFSVVGLVTSKDPTLWGPDAKVIITVEAGTIEVTQHTEGRLEESDSMLDISMTGFDTVQESVGGWLGLDGSTDAGEPPAVCEPLLPSFRRIDVHFPKSGSAMASASFTSKTSFRAGVSETATALQCPV
uniref:VWFD domain-containing protein n=1 Tax=Noctiluca scintillans TaxID=2966 RepID=A0A7S1AQY9_NOCSC|mmetsp:Transcript_56363/g.150733  ORF Transcript_56363/g.150733 Transcript_56363/m.150733 type:complete len:376 (+) Transcript_56363:62-1189(+)